MLHSLWSKNRLHCGSTLCCYVGAGKARVTRDSLASLFSCLNSICEIKQTVVRMSCELGECSFLFPLLDMVSP